MILRDFYPTPKCCYGFRDYPDYQQFFNNLRLIYQTHIPALIMLRDFIHDILMSLVPLEDL